jgi:hypothetical protein
MTRRERLKAIFEGRTPDRPAVKVWGADPRGSINQAGFEQVRQRAVEKTDLFVGSGSAFNIYAGYYESVFPSDKEIQNWLYFIDEGVRYAETLATG